MPTNSVQSPQPNDISTRLLEGEVNGTRRAIAWSSFLFALLQSICGAVVAINGLRLAIGIGALALTTGAGADVVRFHAAWIRRPMIAIALVGSLLKSGDLSACSSSSQPACLAMAPAAFEPQQIEDGARAAPLISRNSCADWNRRVFAFWLPSFAMTS